MVHRCCQEIGEGEKNVAELHYGQTLQENHEQGCVEQRGGQGNEEEIGEEKVGGESAEIVHDQRGRSHLCCKRYANEIPEGSDNAGPFVPPGKGLERWMKHKDGENGGEGELEADVPQQHRVSDEHYKGGKG